MRQNRRPGTIQESKFVKMVHEFCRRKRLEKPFDNSRDTVRGLHDLNGRNNVDQKLYQYARISRVANLNPGNGQ